VGLGRIGVGLDDEGEQSGDEEDVDAGEPEGVGEEAGQGFALPLGGEPVVAVRKSDETDGDFARGDHDADGEGGEQDAEAEDGFQDGGAGHPAIGLAMKVEVAGDAIGEMPIAAADRGEEKKVAGDEGGEGKEVLFQWGCRRVSRGGWLASSSG